MTIRKARGGKGEKIKEPSIYTIYHWVQKNPNFCLKKINFMEKDRIRASTQENLIPFFNKYQLLETKNNYRYELKVFFIIVY